MRIPGIFPASTKEPLLYFCDESHISPEFQFASIGALAVVPERAKKISDDLSEIRKKCNFSPTKEVEWKSYKRRNDCVHTRYINYLFDAISNNYLHFHVLFTPMGNYVNSVNGKKHRAEVISKAYYQLLLHRAGRFYGGQCKLLVRPDNGECTAYLPEIRFGLNNTICEKFGYDQAPISSIRPSSSNNEPLLQLLDVSLGALTAVKNGRYINQEGDGERKRLVNLVLQRAKVADIHVSDSRDRRSQNIWNVTPKGETTVPRR